jgi:hypothetical protein
MSLFNSKSELFGKKFNLMKYKLNLVLSSEKRFRGSWKLDSGWR